MNKEKLLETAKPILFNTEMVRAIQDGRKVQTRRVVPNINHSEVDYLRMDDDFVTFRGVGGCQNFSNTPIREFPKYKKGDILYIRETFLVGGIEDGYDYPYHNEYCIYNLKKGKPIYLSDHFDCGDSNVFADDKQDRPKWKPSIHMPKKYARIFLRVTDVRVERLQDIELNDEIKSEGYPLDYELKENKTYSKDEHGEVDYLDDCEVEWWISLWNSTAKDGCKWDDNPYVFVYEFEVIK